MSDKPDSSVAQATHAGQVRHARQHYDDVSRMASHWSSIIPQCIDAYEREPELRATLRQAQDELAQVKAQDETLFSDYSKLNDECGEANRRVSDLLAQLDTARAHVAALLSHFYHVAGVGGDSVLHYWPDTCEVCNAADVAARAARAWLNDVPVGNE